MSWVVPWEDFDATSAGETCDSEMTLSVTLVVEMGYPAPGIPYISLVV